MSTVVGFTAGIFIGGFIGFVVAALMCAASKRDDYPYCD